MNQIDAEGALLKLSGWIQSRLTHKPVKKKRQLHQLKFTRTNYVQSKTKKCKPSPKVTITLFHYLTNQKIAIYSLHPKKRILLSLFFILEFAFNTTLFILTQERLHNYLSISVHLVFHFNFKMLNIINDFSHFFYILFLKNISNKLMTSLLLHLHRSITSHCLPTTLNLASPFFFQPVSQHFTKTNKASS